MIIYIIYLSRRIYYIIHIFLSITMYLLFSSIGSAITDITDITDAAQARYSFADAPQDDGEARPCTCGDSTCCS